MERKGFTLIEAIMGMALLGLMAVTTLPIINSSFIKMSNYNEKIEMIYIGEMTIETIKAFDGGKDNDKFIYDTKVSDIIDLFNSIDDVEITLPKEEDSEKYPIKLIKKQKCERLWTLSVYVFQDGKGGNVSNVEYKTYLPSK